jgi:hypothetical protein
MVSFYKGSHIRSLHVKQKKRNARNKVVSITRVFCVQHGWYRGYRNIFVPEYGVSYSGTFCCSDSG